MVKTTNKKKISYRPSSLESQNKEDAIWLDLLKRSIHERVIDGVEYPAFPSSELQVRFTGSSYEHVLEEASEFYVFLNKQQKKMKLQLTKQVRFTILAVVGADSYGFS
jgi:hypothetical protein